MFDYNHINYEHYRELSKAPLAIVAKKLDIPIHELRAYETRQILPDDATKKKLNEFYKAQIELKLSQAKDTSMERQYRMALMVFK